MSDNDIEDLLDVYHHAMTIAHKLEFDQYHSIAVHWMNKTDREAQELAQDAIRDHQNNDHALFDHLRNEHSIAIAIKKYKMQIELFLINVKKILGYRAAVSSDRQQLKNSSQLLLNIVS